MLSLLLGKGSSSNQGNLISSGTWQFLHGLGLTLRAARRCSSASNPRQIDLEIDAQLIVELSVKARPVLE